MHKSVTVPGPDGEYLKGNPGPRVDSAGRLNGPTWKEMVWSITDSDVVF